MKLAYGEIRLIRHVLTTTGEMEAGQDGKESLAPRRLNAEESAQRRHFTKNTADAISETENGVKELSDKHNELVKSAKEEYKKENPLTLPEDASEEDKKSIDAKYKFEEELFVSNDEKVVASFKEANEKSKELLEKEFTIDISGKTLDCVKKYFKEFGDNAGFAVGDDEIVEKIWDKLK